MRGCEEEKPGVGEGDLRLEIGISDHEEELDEVRCCDQSSLTWLHRAMKWLKTLCSGALLGFCLLILMTGNQNGKLITGPGGVIVFWLLILFLGCLEGGQNAIVGLQPLDPDLYVLSHPTAAHIIRLTQHRPLATASASGSRAGSDNESGSGSLERYLMGRQLMTVIVIFGINGVGAIHEGCSTLLSLPSPLAAIFCSSGVALIIVTILLGQVTGQIISTRYMLDFINNSIALVTVYASIAIELSGLLHAVHCVSGTIELFIEESPAGDPSSSSLGCCCCPDKGRDLQSKILHWGRVVFSFFCLG
jgi:hypothetical protein